ncbi:hypothetical protein GF386_01455 [Candidatus Pacearchaeota archaeon]|nr:hypothetical protein [Candidatus Pacearchaeota archaeon]MBD3282849.1 hypothetical protein [Candidatus Pacearchaeota archaeon]
MEKGVGNKGNFVHSLLIFFNVLLIFLVLSWVLLYSIGNIKASEKNKQSYLKGELDSLQFQGEDTTALLEETDNGVAVAVTTPDVNLAETGDFLISMLEIFVESGMPVEDELIHFNIGDDGHTLNIEFEGRFGDLVLNNSLLFAEYIAEFCDFEVVENMREKLKSGNVHQINATAIPENCKIVRLPELLATIDWEQMYTDIPQIRGFSDIFLNKNENKTNAFDLDDFFNCDEGFSVDISSTGPNVRLERDSENKVSIYPAKDWVGSEKIIVEFVCEGETYQDSFYVVVGGSSGYNESITEFVENLTGNQTDGNQTSWNQTEDPFYEENQEIIDGKIRILSPRPEGNLTFIYLNSGRTFSIANARYEGIEWSVDGEVVETKSNRFTYRGEYEGEYELEVRIKKGESYDSKLWSVVVRERNGENGHEYPDDESSFLTVLLYIIIAIVVIVVILIAILFFMKKRKKEKPMEVPVQDFNSGTVNMKGRGASRRF